jgi:hypothetical protein
MATIGTSSLPSPISRSRRPSPTDAIPVQRDTLAEIGVVRKHPEEQS